MNEITMLCIICGNSWKDRAQKSCRNCLAPQSQVSHIVTGDTSSFPWGNSMLLEDGVDWIEGRREEDR